MSLYRYLPVPSDRMGIIWALLTVPDAIILEYGPAGTTHYSVSAYGAMGLETNQKIFTTHLSQDDVIMGDVSRLEQAITEIDQNYHPKILFVISSAVISVIGTDINGVCTYMQQEVSARLISVDTGGFRGDYSLGLRTGYSLIAASMCTKSVEKQDGSYNILGASPAHYRIKSDLWEIKDLMKRAFDFHCHTVLGIGCENLQQLESIGSAQINLVLEAEAIPAAEYLYETYGTPYVYGAPYGYHGTKKWLHQIEDILSKSIAPDLTNELNKKNMQASGYKMYADIYAQKEHPPQAVVIGTYDRLVGFSKAMQEINLPVALQICTHSLAGAEADGLITDHILHPTEEKQQIQLLKETDYSLVLGDDISLYLCGAHCEKVTVSSPLIQHKQLAEHLPFMGIRGMDYLLEFVERYFGSL